MMSTEEIAWSQLYLSHAVISRDTVVSTSLNVSGHNVIPNLDKCDHKKYNLSCQQVTFDLDLSKKRKSVMSSVVMRSAF